MSKYDYDMDWIDKEFEEIDRKYGVSSVRREEKISEIKSKSVSAGRTSKKGINKGKVKDRNKRVRKALATMGLCVLLVSGGSILTSNLASKAIENHRFEERMEDYVQDLMIEQGYAFRANDGDFYLNWNEDFDDNSIVVDNSKTGVATLVLWDNTIGSALNGNESAKKMFRNATMIEGMDGTYYSISDISKNKRDSEFIDSLGLDEAMRNYLCGSYGSMISEISNANDLIKDAKEKAKNGDYTLYDTIFNGVGMDKNKSR